MNMPMPGKAHLELGRMEGDWEGKETMYPSQWDPQGGTAIGRVHSRVDLNGFALISDYEQERDGTVTFRGHGVYTYDQKSSIYRLHWFDCMGTPPEVFSGRLEGGVLQLSHGGEMWARLSYDLSQPGLMRSKMEMSPDGSNWRTLFDGEYFVCSDKT